ncbi:hypothetical protein MLD38_020592 [Melastoma candidum]|uniref:Uncharacterized protein n=1 Tax=Melastoma candidum TaxID=119954 RepID=A0ACB9QFA8_9MYRT|nr:hypothetical protein MLD38_020592 [Melastoma candidum]
MRMEGVTVKRGSKPSKARVVGPAEGNATSDDPRRGPWTVEEDFALVNYVAHHGEGRWNSLALCAGLNRTGKSCRLRWLNYLCPGVRRGNITLEEQLLILELHSRWGNRWSKIAQHLPGRTDNEIKNYWRTRVQKHAKQLKCDVNSKQFKDAMRYLWMPRMVERIQAAAAAKASSFASNPPIPATAIDVTASHVIDQAGNPNNMVVPNFPQGNINSTPEDSSMAASSDSFGAQFSTGSEDPLNQFKVPTYDDICSDYHHPPPQVGNYPESSITSPSGSNMLSYGADFSDNEFWLDEFSDNLWNTENVWFPQQ